MVSRRPLTACHCRVVPIGAGGLAGRRNAPTLVNRAYGASFFWDGRAVSLEHQVLQPLLDPREMAATPADVIARLREDASYRQQFLAAFGRGPEWDDVAGSNANPGLDRLIQPLRLSFEEKRALAAFLRSLSGTIWDGV